MKIMDSFCAEAVARLTPKRRLILEVLTSSSVPLSAYEIAQAYKQRGEGNIPPMSVYRILEFLEAEHFVHKLASVGKYIACSHQTPHSENSSVQFLLCAKCNSVKEIELPNSALDDFLGNIEEAGYKLVNPQVELQCICDSCCSQDDV